MVSVHVTFVSTRPHTTIMSDRRVRQAWRNLKKLCGTSPNAGAVKVADNLASQVEVVVCGLELSQRP